MIALGTRVLYAGAEYMIERIYPDGYALVSLRDPGLKITVNINSPYLETIGYRGKNGQKGSGIIARSGRLQLR